MEAEYVFMLETFDMKMLYGTTPLIIDYYVTKVFVFVAEASKFPRKKKKKKWAMQNL